MTEVPRDEMRHAMQDPFCELRAAVCEEKIVKEWCALYRIGRVFSPVQAV